MSQATILAPPNSDLAVRAEMPIVRYDPGDEAILQRMLLEKAHDLVLSPALRRKCDFIKFAGIGPLPGATRLVLPTSRNANPFIVFPLEDDPIYQTGEYPMPRRNIEELFSARDLYNFGGINVAHEVLPAYGEKFLLTGRTPLKGLAPRGWKSPLQLPAGAPIRRANPYSETLKTIGHVAGTTLREHWPTILIAALLVPTGLAAYSALSALPALMAGLGSVMTATTPVALGVGMAMVLPAVAAADPVIFGAIGLSDDPNRPLVPGEMVAVFELTRWLVNLD